MRGEGERRVWTYHGGGERSDDEGKEDGDGSEFETEHGRDYGMEGDEMAEGGLERNGIREERGERGEELVVYKRTTWAADRQFTHFKHSPSQETNRGIRPGYIHPMFSWDPVLRVHPS